MKNHIKLFLILLFSNILCFLMFSLFDWIYILLVNANIINNTFYNFTTLFDYFFNPLIIVIVTSVTAFLFCLNKWKYLYTLFSVILFLIFYVMANNFSLRSILFSILYSLTCFLCTLIINQLYKFILNKNL